MIKTNRQYAATKAQLSKLTLALTAQPAARSKPIDPRFRELHQRALKSQIEELSAEIRDYEVLVSGAQTVMSANSLEDLPSVLIQARIASGLTQRALAERLGVAEQQVQRYEATGYESASFARLKEVADALKVVVPSTVIPQDLAVSPIQFKGRLKELGISPEFLFTKLLPSGLATALRKALESESAATTRELRAAITRAGALVSRVWGLSVSEFFSSTPLQLSPLSAGLRFKRTSSQEAHAKQARLAGNDVVGTAYIVYAHYLALLLIEAVSDSSAQSIPDDPAELRRILVNRYADRGGLSLSGALHFAWDCGIPVLPLSDSGRFHGACWRVAGRNVVVLKQQTQSSARWLFDLLHELRHTAQHPKMNEFTVLESSASQALEEDRISDEEDAMQFAGDVLLEGRAEEIAQLAVDEADGKVERLKSVIARVAKREGVDIAPLANYMAYRLAQQGVNWWGAANNLQVGREAPFVVARDVFLERADLSKINPVDRQLILAALSESEAHV